MREGLREREEGNNSPVKGAIKLSPVGLAQQNDIARHVSGGAPVVDFEVEVLSCVNF